MHKIMGAENTKCVLLFLLIIVKGKGSNYKKKLPWLVAIKQR